MDKKLKIILIAMAILGLIALNLIVFLNAHEPQTADNNNETNIINTIVEHNIATEEETEADRKEMLSNSTEATRMKTYIGQYISAIDSEDYETAYNMLYQEFRNTYFKTLEEFITYVENKYPDEIMVTYNNMEREGTIYIISISIQNPLDSNFQTIEQNIVIQEKDLNNFTLSFNVE